MFNNITTVEGAIEAMAHAVENRPEEAAELLSIANDKLPNRSDFSETQFYTVLTKEGNLIVSQIKSNRSGISKLIFSGIGHEEDCCWEYPETSYEVISGVDPSESIPQAEWYKISNKIGWYKKPQVKPKKGK